jgi:hypothetical protein
VRWYDSLLLLLLARTRVYYQLVLRVMKCVRDDMIIRCGYAIHIGFNFL